MTIYTYEEIIDNFQNSKFLNDDFKNEILGRINSTLQAMVNITNNKVSALVVTDSHSDFWVESYNEVMMKYQRYDHKTAQ